MAGKTELNPELRGVLRVPQRFDTIDDLTAPNATPAYPKKSGKDAVDDLKDEIEPELSDLQERLFAAGQTDGNAPSVLVILQGMDTSGKGGVIRHAFGMVDPQGIQLKAFKRPTEEELAHDFLWRIRKELPRPGMIGIFDRSQYEDVLIGRVDSLVPEKEWRARYDLINEFEAEVVASGTRIIKCFLNVSHEKQHERLAARLDNPEKYWKYETHDVDVRAQWEEYMEAYADALKRCNPDQAPWYVIPADRKWYRNWAVAQILLEEMRALNLGWPEADFDVEKEKKRLAGT